MNSFTIGEYIVLRIPWAYPTPPLCHILKCYSKGEYSTGSRLGIQVSNFKMTSRHHSWAEFENPTFSPANYAQSQPSIWRMKTHLGWMELESDSIWGGFNISTWQHWAASKEWDSLTKLPPHTHTHKQLLNKTLLLSLKSIVSGISGVRLDLELTSSVSFELCSIFYWLFLAIISCPVKLRAVALGEALKWTFSN